MIQEVGGSRRLQDEALLRLRCVPMPLPPPPRTTTFAPMLRSALVCSALALTLAAPAQSAVPDAKVGFSKLIVGRFADERCRIGVEWQVLSTRTRSSTPS